jgi:hypothetical protein
MRVNPIRDKSLQVARLWESLKLIENDINQNAIPLLGYLEADPDGELIQTLQLASDAINQYLAKHRLVIEQVKR